VGTFRYVYPVGTTAQHRKTLRPVEVIYLIGPTTGEGIESADLHQAQALVQFGAGDVRLIPVDELLVPEHPTGSYYAVMCRRISDSAGGDKTENVVFAAAGRAPEYRWAVSWSDGPFEHHYQWSEATAEGAHSLAKSSRAD
jgi:hypothetical protein